jgi:hypothetical protein
MTFDVSQLPGRAQELKAAGVDAAYREMTRFGGGGSGALQAAEDYMAGVESIYDDFLDIPDPESFAPTCTSLATAMGRLATEGHTNDPITGAPSLSGHNPNLSLVGSSGDLFLSWTGDAADAYKTHYADKFVPTASSQYAAMSVLLNAVNAEACVWAAMRDDLDKLSSRAIELMKKAGNKGGAEWAAVLSIAAAVITIPVTGGASAIAIPAVAAGLSVAATGIGLATSGGGTKDELGLDAGASDKVISSLETALGKVKTHAIEGETKIWEAMNGACGAIDDGGAVFCLPRPSLADAPHHPVNDSTMAGSDV